MISSISIDRLNEDSDPDPNGRAEIAFYDQRGAIVAFASVTPEGRVFAHSLADTTINARAVLEVGETVAES